MKTEDAMADFLDMYPWTLPIIIFLGRVCDVPLSTIRIIFVARGERKIAPLIGFAEVFIWIVVISQVLARANNLLSYLSYAGGFAAGTYIGLVIEERMALGFYKFSVFTKHKGEELIKTLNRYTFGATLFNGQGAMNPVDVVETIVSRKNKKSVENIIRDFDPAAFVVVEEIKSKSFGIFTRHRSLIPARMDK